MGFEEAGVTRPFLAIGVDLASMFSACYCEVVIAQHGGQV